jgi:hypothetical protein
VVRKEDDLELLKTERDAADREYNDALTRLDRAIQQLPAAFPHPPPPLDEHQITPLNTLWTIVAPPAGEGGIRGRFTAAVRRVIAPFFEQQQAFNSAVVDHINRNVPIASQTRESIDTMLTVLHDQVEALAAFESLLVIFLQQITPYVDTRDRNVAGLLRGLSGSINAVADELMKRTDALLARGERHEMRAAELEATIATMQQQIATLREAVAGAGRGVSASAPQTPT